VSKNPDRSKKTSSKVDEEDNSRAIMSATTIKMAIRQESKIRPKKVLVSEVRGTGEFIFITIAKYSLP
jgi:hypothetical protein